MSKTFLAILALAALVAPQTLAEHCTKPTLDRDSEELRVMDPETGDVRYYVDRDACEGDGCVDSIWIYEETNALENLQRRDPADARDPQDDTCHGMIRPDSVVL